MLRPFALLVLATLAAGARAIVVSQFETGVDDWTTLNTDPTTLTVIPGSEGVPGWNPAGYLDTYETRGGLFLYSAPAKFLGSKTDYFGGTVSFDESSDTNDHNGDPLVFFLVSADRSIDLAYAVAPATPGYPGLHYEIPLRQQPGDWFRITLDAQGNPHYADATDADFVSVLSDLGFVGINADYTTATTDHTTLDNVVMAVPEPAPLVALAFGGLLVRRRRR